MRHRRGITLIEVLAAIFIMGVGLLAILTLFPVGAISMAQALRDDRGAQAAASASALANALDLRNDPNVVAALTAAPPAPYLPADPNGWGYPVYVDPFYVALNAGPLGAAGGGPTAGGSPGLQRCSNPAWSALPSRLFSLPDDLNFDPNGLPSGSPSAVDRPRNFTWAYVVRRSVTGVGNNPVPLAEVSVVVYANRSVQIPGGETVLQQATPMGAKGTTTLTLPAGQPVNVRKGSWVLDTSYAVTAGGGGSVNAFFYRVNNVSDNGQGVLTLELETPLKANVQTLVIMENVIAVLDRGTGWQP
jgi:prepilin-type N-terminal cleavage/methylation domain-containing protein